MFKFEMGLFSVKRGFHFARISLLKHSVEINYLDSKIVKKYPNWDLEQIQKLA